MQLSMKERRFSNFKDICFRFLVCFVFCEVLHQSSLQTEPQRPRQIEQAGLAHQTEGHPLGARHINIDSTENSFRNN